MAEFLGKDIPENSILFEIEATDGETLAEKIKTISNNSQSIQEIKEK